jgi:hypothetical protein
MAEVLHRYIPAEKKPPQPPSPEQREVERLKAEKLEADRRFVEEKTRQTTVQRTLNEAELLRKRGELIYRDEAVRQASYLCITVRQRLLGLARSLPRQLEGKTAHQMKMVIDGAVRECLTELSELPNVITREGYERFVESEQK